MMQAESRRTLFAPLHYWRTVLLVPTAGLLVATLFRDSTAVLFSTLGCAFLFSAYERRRWIVMPPDTHAGDIVLRLCYALAITYVLCRPQA